LQYHGTYMCTTTGTMVEYTYTMELVPNGTRVSTMVQWYHWYYGNS
jgi:hypothetical protein